MRLERLEIDLARSSVLLEEFRTQLVSIGDEFRPAFSELVALQKHDSPGERHLSNNLANRHKAIDQSRL